MSRGHALLLALLLVGTTGLAAAQNATTPQHPPALVTRQSPPPEVLHTSTQLVIVDVVVQDRSGHPVHGLTRDNFLITEQKRPQVVRNFDEHKEGPAVVPAFPSLPPGTFTDLTPVAPDSTLNVLLIDTLNTPMKDQMFVRQQLLNYIKHAKSGTRMAIFGLSSQLYMLQGFTTDPAILRSAIDHHLLARSSPLMDDPTGLNGGDDAADSAIDATSEAASSMQQFESERQSFQTQLRIQYTIDAFDSMGHYLANFPGRKNLIWFSGAFPIDIMPDPSLNDPFSVMETNDEEFHEMTNLLTHAQVAVYPIDARGLMGAPMWDASRSGSNYVSNHAAFGQDLMKFNQSQAEEHMTMDQMASDTGGRAFYNTNGLADAVDKALEAGANYYTLTYSPSNHDWDGSFRNIRVELMGPPAAQQLRLSYRHGYYADDPERPGKHATAATATAASVAETADRGAAAYTRAALARGAPAPADIPFKVRVLPISTTTSDTLAPENAPNPDGKLKGPYRQYGLDYVALSRSFSLTHQPDGRYTGQIEVSALVYDSDGVLLNAIGKTVHLNLTPETYKRFMSSGLGFHLEISTPARQISFLRLFVHDVPTNRYGVVEIPTDQVSRLAPLPPPPAPPNPAGSSSSAKPPVPATSTQPPSAPAKTGAKQ